MPDLESVSVSADEAREENGDESVLLKIQGASYEVNVRIRREDVSKLRELPSWKEGSIQIGMSAGSPCFWSIDENTVSVLTGYDNQSWDLGVWFSADALRQIVAEAESVYQSAT